jgi:hypothetical protein
MDNSWLIKGIAFLLLAISLGIILWLVRQKPKKIIKRRKVVRTKIAARRRAVMRKRVVKRKKLIKKKKPARKPIRRSRRRP